MVIQDKVVSVLMEYLGLERELISLNSKIKRDFGMDDNDFVQMLRLVESSTDAKIDDNKIDEIETVYDLIEYIEEVHLSLDENL